jgi:D-3-phosphoglycerate dehydrogenase
MQVGRNRPGDEAIMVLNVDSEVPQDAMDEIVQIEGVFSAKYAKI